MLNNSSSQNSQRDIIPLGETRKLPDIRILEEHFEYDPWTGKLFAAKDYQAWRKGNEVGWNHGHGYLQIMFRSKTYYCHRLIWKLVFGEDPHGYVIDHIDGDPRNNRLYNLRLVTQSQNQRNRKLNVNNSTGVPGLTILRGPDGHVKYWLKMAGKDFGYFPSFEAAAKFQETMSGVLGFHRNHGRGTAGGAK